MVSSYIFYIHRHYNVYEAVDIWPILTDFNQYIYLITKKMICSYILVMQWYESVSGRKTFAMKTLHARRRTLHRWWADQFFLLISFMSERDERSSGIIIIIIPHAYNYLLFVFLHLVFCAQNAENAHIRLSWISTYRTCI